jgi:hypothetical protein
LALLLLTFGLTQAIYPVTYGALESLEPWALCLVLGRNVLLLVWAALAMRRQPGRDQKRPTATKPAAPGATAGPTPMAALQRSGAKAGDLK